MMHLHVQELESLLETSNFYHYTVLQHIIYRIISIKLCIFTLISHSLLFNYLYHKIRRIIPKI